MEYLGTSQAADIAAGVYKLRRRDITTSLKKTDNNLGLQNSFKIIEGGRFEGTSGLILKFKSGFGYIAEGQGRKQGEVVIACRGTASNISDITTDLNQGFQTGPSGWPVHAGFNETFNSFKHELKTYFAGKNPTHVHCVGHSLGGALASLTADYIIENKIATASIYTFGCPRTGAMGFARQLTQRVRTENIFRVHHTADPVSMLPLFPFAHAPVSSTDISLLWNGSFIFAQAHFMENYISSVNSGDNSLSWDQLRSISTSRENRDDIAKWLESTSHQEMFMHSGNLLWMISKALTWIIKKITQSLGMALAASATLLDQLAWILTQGTLASVEISTYVSTLMSRILQFLGKGISMAGEITVAFVRWVLSMLFTTVSNFANLGLSLIAKNG